MTQPESAGTGIVKFINGRKLFLRGVLIKNDSILLVNQAYQMQRRFLNSDLSDFEELNGTFDIPAATIQYRKAAKMQETELHTIKKIRK